MTSLSDIISILQQNTYLSLKNCMQTVEQVLQKERKNIKFDINVLSEILYGVQQLKQIQKVLNKDFFIPHDYNLLNKGRVQLIKQSYRTLPLYFNNLDWSAKPDIIFSFLSTFYQLPGSVHIGMFMKVIQIMGTKSQKQKYLKKCQNLQIVGCYAQTQMGHGSDVQNLQTTATYILGKDQFIINTPTVASTKYWPGQLGILCTHAMVYAQMIVKGKNQGTHAFIVQIRDQNHNLLPGIEAGDIGPKIGFHTKDNGYLILKDVIIPKSNMLRGFISVSKKGEIKKKGDPKVSYATMMRIRQIISCLYPKIYSQGIIIGVRYNLFRKQFKDQHGIQQSILSYQTQSDKILTRVAQYYAITVAGNCIRDITEQNFKMVTQKNNFDLMNQTHACLCVGKAYFSQIVVYGLQTLRKACGGHGFSHFSGLPHLISQYIANLTLEGQNTVMYLQVSRFVLKNYKWFVSGKKKLAQSCNYIERFDQLIDTPLDPTKDDWSKLTTVDLQNILMQSVFSLIRRITIKMMTKQEGKPDVDVWNYQAGSQIQKLAVAHSIVYTFNCFNKQVKRQQNPLIKQILNNLNQLYGIQMFINLSNEAITQGLISAQQISAIRKLKQKLLQNIRPHLIGVVDAFAIPDKFLRSAFTKGNPYQNFLELARQTEINKKIQDSAYIVKNGIPKALAMHPVAKL